MSFFTFSNFFDLSNFSHKKIFNPKQPVWEVLNQISTYFNTLELGVIEGDVSPHAFLIQPEKISIGKGTVVEPGAYIKGPCVIGENCEIRHGAYLRGNVITGNDCVIGHDTEVKHALFLNGAKAAHFAYVGNSILGNRCNLGAGTKLANLKLNQQNISIYFKENRIDTEMKKFGAIIGDEVQIGCNSVTNPGTLLGKGVVVYPCLSIGGVIPSNHLVKQASNYLFVQENQ